MYASVHDHHHISYTWLLRECGRLGGLIVMFCWIPMAIVELKRFGLPAPDAFMQAGALAVVFTGYFIGWRKELVGALLIIIGTVAFYVAHAVTFAGAPMPAAALLAAPGVFFLLARSLEEHRGGEVTQSHEH